MTSHCKHTVDALVSAFVWVTRRRNELVVLGRYGGRHWREGRWKSFWRDISVHVDRGNDRGRIFVLQSYLELGMINEREEEYLPSGPHKSVRLCIKNTEYRILIRNIHSCRFITMTGIPCTSGNVERFTVWVRIWPCCCMDILPATINMSEIGRHTDILPEIEGNNRI